MRPSDIEYLGFIAHFLNLGSLLEHGILSHNMIAARGIPHYRIDNPKVNERRENKPPLPNTKRLHDYANLYFNPRNAMMRARVDTATGEGHANLLVLQVSRSIINLPGVLATDMNAAKGGARIQPSNEILAELQRGQIYTRYWNDPDESIKRVKMARMMAEVLVPDCIPLEYIVGIAVSCHRCEHRARIAGVPDKMPIRVLPDLFFQTDAGPRIPWQE